MISTLGGQTAPFEQAYGYFEAKLRFNTTSGQWSAFWLQSATIGSPLGDPATAGVEMDIAEHRLRCVSAPCVSGNDVTDRIQQALIWDGYDPAISKAAVNLSTPLPGLGNGSWHTYALRWTPTELIFSYDDTPTWTISGPISRRSQYLILSSEVGEFFAGAIPAGGYGSRATSTTNMQADYVRVWSFAPQNTVGPALGGTPAPGRGLSCSPGSWTEDLATGFTYEWLSDGAPVAGATGVTYAVTTADQGHVLSCRVTASNAAASTSAASNALLVPAPVPVPAPRLALAPLPAPDRTAPVALLSGSRTQPLGTTVAVAITCPAEACRATTTGNVRVPRIGRTRARAITAPAVTKAIARGAKATVKVRLSTSARIAIRRALRAHRRIVVKLSVRVADSAGNARTLTRQVTLRLPRR
jgi:hypothetical protein